MSDTVHRFLNDLYKSNYLISEKEEKFGELTCSFLKKNTRFFPLYGILYQEIERIKSCDKKSSVGKLCSGIDEKYKVMLCSKKEYKQQAFKLKDIYHSRQCTFTSEKIRCENCKMLQNNVRCYGK